MEVSEENTLGRTHGEDSYGLSDLRVCPACGAELLREMAQFCATCGKHLDDDGYLPADAIRASYHFQYRELPVIDKATTQPGLHSRPATRKRDGAFVPFQANDNGPSTTALAFATYALVPYLGILFCPGALVMGSIGLVRAKNFPQDGGRRASVLSLVLGVVILGAQLFLWWILYKIPDWTRQGGF